MPVALVLRAFPALWTRTEAWVGEFSHGGLILRIQAWGGRFRPRGNWGEGLRLEGFVSLGEVEGTRGRTWGFFSK